MTSSYELPDGVQWSEGMLLSPQHLQQNDLYWQSHLRHRLECITPHYWGIRSLAIDPAGLADGVVRLTEIDCMLPDGHAVVFPGNYAPRSLEIDITEHCKGEGRSVRVWLAVPVRGLTAASSMSPERRYDSLPGQLTADENLDDGLQVEVGRLQARIRLHAGSALPSKYCGCPLLEVARDAQGQFQLTSYHPPLLQVGASAFHDRPGARLSLQAQLTDLTQKLRAKLRELAGDRSDDMAEDETALGPDTLRHLATARYLAASLPQLEIAVAAPRLRPEDAYRAIAQVVGQVACIGPNPVALRMEPYLHDDCMPQFQAAFDYILNKVSLVNTAVEQLKFGRIGDAGFARRLPEELDEVIVELRPRDGQSLQEMSRWLIDARIASDSLMPVLQRRRMHGATVRPLTAQEIARRNLRPQAALFLIENQAIELEDKGMQQMFQPNQSLLIEGAPGNHAPAAIILHRKKPAGAGPSHV